VSKSAIQERRERTLLSIARCARTLTGAHGVDGFTMEELAEAVGVSRRTLFNYVPSKIDAILGLPKGPDDLLLEVFVAGGPTGHLTADIKAVVVSSLEAKDTAPEEIEEFRRLIASEPRLMTAVHERMAELIGFMADAIQRREGSSFDSVKARTAAIVTLAIADEALNRFIADPAASLADHYARVFDAATSLFSA
jgi:AcrR family transcriptional regulator